MCSALQKEKLLCLKTRSVRECNKTPVSHRGSNHLCSLARSVFGRCSRALHCRIFSRETWWLLFMQQRQLSERSGYLIRTCMSLTLIHFCMPWQWKCFFFLFFLLFVLGETYQFLVSLRLGGLVSSACAIWCTANAVVLRLHYPFISCLSVSTYELLSY